MCRRSLTEWRPESGHRVAGVSSFGIGGTNAHVIVEEAIPAPARNESPSWQLLPISAKSPEALDKATERLGEHLTRHPELNLADVAFTLQLGRKPFEYRRVVASEERHNSPILKGLSS